jgi:ribonuclease HI
MTLKQANKPHIAIWTDGSIQPTNPGLHGGWGAVIVGQEVNEGHLYRAISGYYQDASSPRSEAFAAMHSLSALAIPCKVTIVTDCQYVIRCVANLQRGIMPKTHQDIWELVRPLVKVHRIHCDHVHSHSRTDQEKFGDKLALNRWADKLAYNAAYAMVGVNEYHNEIPKVKKYAPPHHQP